MAARMNPVKLVRVVAYVVALIAAGAAAQSAEAAVLTWNNGSGDFVWSSTSGSLDWSGAAWSNGSDALFASSGAGAVSLGTPISANSVTFTAPGYSISGGNVLTVAGGGITDNATGTTRISSNVVLSAAPVMTVTAGTLALGGDLTRPAGTALVFANAGTITLNTVNGIAVGTAVNNNNGILGGWAVTGEQFATYANGKVSTYAQNYTVSGGNVLSNASTTSNVLAADATAADQTITSSLTINSLIEQHDLFVNSGATLTLASGGVIFSGQNFWLQSSTSGGGYVTSSFGNGSGGDDLIATVNNASYNDMRFHQVIIANNGATPVTLIKAGSGLLTLDGAAESYTGGTIVTGGTLALGYNNGSTGTLQDNLTIDPGAAVNLTAGNALGYGGSNWVTHVTVNRGVLNTNNTGDEGWGLNITMTAGTMSSTVSGGHFAMGNNPVVTVNAAAAPSVISAQMNVRSNNVFNVSRGSGAADLLISGNLVYQAGGGLTFNGNGITVLTGSDNYQGTTTIGGGTLQFGNGGATGFLNPSYPIVDNGELAFNRSDAISQGTNFSSAAITGTGGLVQIGPGTLTLNNTNSYSGLTTVGAGTLALGPAGTVGTGGVTIVPGGVLDVSAYGSSGYSFSGGVLTAGRTSSPATDINGSLNVSGAVLSPTGSNSTMTFSGSLAMNGGTLNYYLGDLVALPNGALTLSGSDYIVPQSQLSTGTIALFTYHNGAPNPNDLSVAGPNLSSRQTYTFSASSGTVSLAVTGNAGNLSWTGAGSVWYSGSASTKNWYNANSASADWFYTGDSVTFSDSGSSPQNVAISGAVRPGSITISNTAVSYIFSGTGSIVGGTSLLVNGPGSLTINNSNAYSGGTTLNGGVLNDGAANSLGTGPLAINGGTLNASYPQSLASATLNNGGLLDFAGSNALGGVTLTIGGGSLDNSSGSALTLSGNSPQNWNGNFTFVGSNPLNTGSAAVSLGSSRTVTVNANTLTVGGVISGSGESLIKAGTGMLTLGAANTYTGTTTINGGTLQLGTGQNGQDGSISNSNTGGVTNNSALVYNLFGNSSAVYAILGSGNLTKLGQGQLTLAASNVYTGTTSVRGGGLNINGGDSSSAMVVSGGSLYVNVSSPAASVSVAGGATFGGSGSLPSAGANVANGGILDFSQNTSSTFHLGSVTYAGSSTLNLGNVTNYTSVPFLSAGVLTTSGQVSINANLGAVSVLAGTYDLVSYGSIAGTGTSAFQLASVSGITNRQTAALAYPPNQVDLVVTPQTLYWNGTQADWLAANAWTLHPANTLATFQAGDPDVFDDSASTGASGGMVQLNSGNLAPGSVTFNNLALAYTVSGGYGITGSGALAVQGGGLLTLLTSNSYTGGTSVTMGTLQLGNGGAAGSLPPSGAISLGGSGTLVFSRSNGMVQGIDFGGPINGAGNVVQNGPGVVVVTMSNGYTGATAINGGTLQLGAGQSGQDGSLSGTSGVADNGTLAYNLAGSQTAAYSISGSGSVTMSGPGLLALATTNTYTGGTTVNGGTLVLAAGRTGLGQIRGALTINPGGAVICGAHNVFGYSGSAATLSTLNINGGLLDKAAGSGPNEMLTGVTVTMSGGTWAGTGGYFDLFYNNYGDPNDSVTVLAGTATAYIMAPLNFRSVSPLFTIGSGFTPSGIDLLVGGQLTGGNGFIKDGPGVMALTSPNNTYSGVTTIRNGTLQLGNGAPGYDAALNGTSGVANSGNLVFDVAGSQTAAYAISGSGSLFMTGSGTVVLAASNGYTGSTTVNAGKLYANGPLASVVTVNGGIFGGSGTSPGAAVAPGGGIEGGYNGFGTLALGSLGYFGSGSFTTNGYASYPVSGGAAPLNVTFGNGLFVEGGPITVNLGGAPAAGTFHLIEYAGSIGGSGFPAFALGKAANNARGQLSFALVNDPGYVDVAVTVTPVIWTGSLSTAWNQPDTLPAPMNWLYAGSGTRFQAGDFVQFDNSTVAGGTVTINNGNVLPGGVVVNNDLGHPYTLTGSNGISGSGPLVKNGPGSLTIFTGNTFSGGLTINGGTLVAAAGASGSNSVLGLAGSSQTITVNAGSELLFVVPNVMATAVNEANIAALNINGGTVTNAEPGAPYPAGLVNNALGNVSLTNGVLTATTGQHGGYAAWDVNGTITSSGISLISTSDPVYGTVMLNSTAGSGAVGVTTFDVAGGTLTVSAPLVQDNVDRLTSGLLMTGAGTMVLSGSNTYMGGTTVDAGTLVVESPHSLANGSSLTVGIGASSLFAPAAFGELGSTELAEVRRAVAGPAAGEARVASVPEPGTLLLLALAAVCGASYHMGWRTSASPVEPRRRQR
jgi:fibronectin-binding autotransporter adhesin